MSRGARTAAPAVPPELRRATAAAGAVAALVLATLAVLYAAGGALGGFDRTEPAEDGIGPPLRPVALVIDFGGEPLGAAVLVATLAVACLARGRPRLAVLAVAGPAVTVASTTAIKHLVGRTIHGGHLAFPSGHTAFATALALVLALLVVDLARTGRRATTLVLAGTVTAAGTLMAWSQVALGAHYPTDTLGGFCTALAIVPPAAWLLDTAVEHVLM